MTTILCITILAYCILGKDIKALMEKLGDVDWKCKADEVMKWLRPYAIKAGRVAAKPLLQFYYVMTDENTSTLDRILVYAAIIYTISPVSLIPSAIYKVLGLLDEGAAMLYVYKKVKERITPEINFKVEDTLNQWFGVEYELIEE
ncbi:MAG: YkvA family protein [Muribaculaceae bacterium]